MWQNEVTIKSSATPQQIWSVWSDVKNWREWDNEVEWSEINGKFEVGATGVLKPKGGPKSNFKMIACEPYKSFTDRSFLPLCKIDFIHEIHQIGGGITISHKVQISGFLTFLFSKVIGNKIIKELPKAMEKLNQIAITK